MTWSWLNLRIQNFGYSGSVDRKDQLLSYTWILNFAKPGSPNPQVVEESTVTWKFKEKKNFMGIPSGIYFITYYQ